MNKLCALQADNAHFHVTVLVAKRMAAFLKLFMPFLDNATVRTAVSHLAVGMSGFKAEDPDKPEEAAAVLPLVYSFITAVIPYCNEAFSGVSPNQACMEDKSGQHVEAVCDVLVLAIRTFESAVEVTLRCKVQEASELFRCISCAHARAVLQCLAMPARSLMLLHAHHFWRWLHVNCPCVVAW